MKSYKITVNGVQYDVTVEEVLGGGVTPAPSVSGSASPVSFTAKPRENTSNNLNGYPLKAPMPGTITKILVSAGDMVKEGQTLLILEAMKMENEISAPVSGKILSITAVKGSSVKTDDILLTIEEV